MSKELTRKIIEAGIVPPQAVKLMKLWGNLDDDLPESGKQEQTENELLTFVGEIGRLLAEDQEIPEVKESIQGLAAMFSAAPLTCKLWKGRQAEGEPAKSVEATMVKDRLGHFIVRRDNAGVEALLLRGNLVEVDEGTYEIYEICPIYEEDEPKYFMCTVGGGLHAEMQRV